MRQILFLVSALLFALSVNAEPLRVMLVTGDDSGNESHRVSQLFDSFSEIEYAHYLQPEASQKLASEESKQYDVLVFCNLWDEFSESEKQIFLNLTKEGKPFLFLNKNIVANQNWPEFEKLLTGKDVERSTDISGEELPAGNHDVWVNVNVVSPRNFKVQDHGNGNFRVLPNVKPTLTANQQGKMPVIALENKCNNSKVVYIQSGDNEGVFESEKFKTLMLQAINYLGEQEEVEDYISNTATY